MELAHETPSGPITEEEYNRLKKIFLKNIKDAPLDVFEDAYKAEFRELEAKWEQQTLQENILEELKAAGEPTESEKLMDQMTIELLQHQIETLPLSKELQELSLEMARMQFEEYMSPEAQRERELSAQLVEWQLEGIAAAREMGGITGDLSEQEMTALNEIEAGAIQTLTDTINRETEEIFGSVVANLVDRGVLQGDIGAKTMADVQNRAQELIAQGTTEFASMKAGNIIAMGEAQKARQLQIQQMLQTGAISREQLQQQWAGSGMNYQTTQQQFAQAGAQFSGQMADQYHQLSIGTQAGMWEAMGNWQQMEAQRKLDKEIARMQASAAKDANMWGAVGSIAGMAMMSSRDFKKNIVEVDSLSEEEMLEKIEGVKLYRYKYKDNIVADDKEHTGAITEELPVEVVTSDGKHIDVVSYLGYLTACIKVLAKRRNG